jgi:hypothetical protein
MWYEITVPRLASGDAQSLTTNPINLKDFTICTLTDDLKDSGGNTISDAGTFNKTAVTETPTFTYSYYVASDNTGWMTSYDPIYGLDQNVVLYVKISGTNYEFVEMTGFDDVFEKGSALYGYKTLYAYSLADDGDGGALKVVREVTKWKIGNDYYEDASGSTWDGSGTIRYGLDLTGYTGDVAVMQLYLYANSDADYFKSTGNYGPNKVELGEHTVTLQD